MRMQLIAVVALSSIVGVPAAIAAEDAKPTPPKADSGGAMKADPKTGTSPPTQAGGAGVEGKSDAGSGQTKSKDK